MHWNIIYYPIDPTRFSNKNGRHQMYMAMGEVTLPFVYKNLLFEGRSIGKLPLCVNEKKVGVLGSHVGDLQKGTQPLWRLHTGNFWKSHFIPSPNGWNWLIRFAFSARELGWIGWVHKIFLFPARSTVKLSSCVKDESSSNWATSIDQDGVVSASTLTFKVSCLMLRVVLTH